MQMPVSRDLLSRSARKPDAKPLVLVVGQRQLNVSGIDSGIIGMPGSMVL